MKKEAEISFDALYKNFNDRNIEAVIEHMTSDVQWANGMEGGYVFGHEAVKEYWTRQFKSVSAKVTPLEIKNEGDSFFITVHQVVHDVNGTLLADTVLKHIFHLSDGKIYRFDIGE